MATVESTAQKVEGMGVVYTMPVHQAGNQLGNGECGVREAKESGHELFVVCRGCGTWVRKDWDVENEMPGLPKPVERRKSVRVN